MKILPSLVLLLSLPLTGWAFTVSNNVQRRIPSSVVLQSTSSAYGRGAEIWPECNKEKIRLEDSFPNGIIPFDAKPMMTILPTSEGTATNTNNPIVKKIDPTPAVIAASLLLSGLVRPLDIITVAALGGYLGILHRFARSSRSDGVAPLLPALPPQGHVPDLVLNPLGQTFGKAGGYEGWLKTGAVLSLLAPLASILSNTVLGTCNLEAARACARPLFLLCCQAVGETIMRRTMSPLPLRILVPVLSNTVRLLPLWSWAALKPSSPLTRVLAYGNLVYWSINLFGFLLPVAVMRYLRVHFYCVEAEEVQTRPGFEGAVGLMSS